MDEPRSATGPLSGFTVVEAASYIAGPYGAMMLADLGARVVKVEPPRGDPYRRFGRQYGDASLQFRATNQGKESVALDLKTPEGISAFFALVSTADLLLTNWRPGVAESLGITPERIRQDFPTLVWVRVSGYGQDGPRSSLPAYDGIIQAQSGALLASSDQPLNMRNNVADKVSAMFAAQAATAALLERAETGRGRICDVAMLDAMAYFYGGDISAGHRLGADEPDHAVAVAAGNAAFFATADGWLSLAPVSGRQIRRAMEAAGIGDQFGDVMDAGADHIFAAFSESMSPALLSRAAAEWDQIFRDADVPATAVLDFEDHLEHEQVRHNRIYTPVDDPGTGTWMHARFPALFDGQPAAPAHRTAPSLGT